MKEISNDLVSVIMPSYNTGEYISEAIESVLCQTYANWELIIVDDCSIDDTDTIVKRFLTKDHRIKYIKNDTNKGAAFSRNMALQEATGRWIAFLDSDDVWFPDKLKKQLDFMKKMKCSFSYHEYEKIDMESNLIGIRVSGPKVIKKNKMNDYCYPGCLTVLYDVNEIGLIQIPNIKKNNDYAMWLQISKKTECMLFSECLAKYRVRAGSISRDHLLMKIKSHYELFRVCEEKTVFVSIYHLIRNLLFGIIKKIKYEQKVIDKL